MTAGVSYDNDGVLGRRTAQLIRWGPWLFWPMLVITLALLAYRIVDGDGPGTVITAGLQVLFWVCLLINNRSVWRRHREALERGAAGG